MRKKILVYMETDTDNTDTFIGQDIIQELSCCSCYFEDIIIKIMNVEDDENETDQKRTDVDMATHN